MPSLKLHLKTALLASAVALVLLVVSFLVVSASIASQIQTEQKDVAQFAAETLAENLSLLPEETSAEDLRQIAGVVSGSRQNPLAARVWKLKDGDFVEQAASDDWLPPAVIPPETKNALLSNAKSRIVTPPAVDSHDSIYRSFAPIVAGGKITGAVEVVERLDTVSSIALRYAANLIWIALAAIVLMSGAFYLLFQNLVYQPLEKLLTAMEKAKTGNLSAEIAENIRRDEFGQLSENFNSMMAQIREMTEERARQTEILQEKVSEATRQLVQKNEQLESANLELFRSTRKMAEMERLAAAGQTAAEFAHEVGTPLNLISGHVQLLETSLPAGSREANRLKTINTQIERISQTVREMLDRTRFGVGQHLPLDLNELLRKTFDAIEPALEENRVELGASLAENLPPISGDENRLQQVFLNLVNNALDAMPAGGKLDVATRFENDKVTVTFTDNGVGMSAETSAKIFQPLFTTKERGRGTGLGLVVVRQILQEHEAEITVESEQGKSTTFYLSFNVYTAQ